LLRPHRKGQRGDCAKPCNEITSLHAMPAPRWLLSGTLPHCRK
jgi:hypothetical protein